MLEPVTPEWPSELDDTDITVLELLARNVAIDEICRLAGCSRRTVSRRLAALRSSCGASTTIEVVVRAVRAGII